MRSVPLLLAATLASSFAAQAQALTGGVSLGLSIAQLQQAVPAARPLARPARLAGGLVGSWAGPPFELAGVALTPTYFFAEGQLRRVEYLATGGAAAFEALRAWGRSQWGAELASQAPEGLYATWAAGELDAYLQQAQGARVRLVVKRAAGKDDTAL